MLKEFEIWFNNLPNTQKHEVMEFLTMMIKAHQSKLVLGMIVNITPRNEITFDTNKMSYSALKNLLL